MGHFVIACYRPKPGKEADLLAEVKAHLPALRGQGLVTDRPPYAMRAQDGTIVEVFEWQSEAAVNAAHSNPVVLAMWERFGACCEMVSLRTLAETEGPFPHFAPVDV